MLVAAVDCCCWLLLLIATVLKLSQNISRVGIVFQKYDEKERKRVSPGGNRLVGDSKRMNKMGEYGVFIPCYGEIEKLTNRKALQLAMLTKIIQSI